MPSTVDCGRGLLGFLGPLTGARATGQITIVPEAGAPSQSLVPPNSFMVPVVNGSVRHDMPVRVLPNYDNADGGAAWALPPTGGPVSVETLVGGARHNLPAGTVMRWADDIPDGFDISGGVLATGGLSGADSIPTYGVDGLKYVGMFESLGTPTIDLEAFRSTVGDFPAAVLIWEGADKATLELGRGDALYLERWNLIVITSRSDSDSARRGEGMRLLDSAEELLTWQTIYGDDDGKGFGIVVSAVSSSDILSRYRLTGKTEAYQQVYVYGIRLATKRKVSKVDRREFAQWLKTRIKAQNTDTNPPTDPNPLTLADVTEDMPQS